ncbi:MAG: late competence development ComFB family protein, partial [Oscillospiraceae bacterium]
NAVENSLKELFEQENSHLFTPPVAPAPVSTSAPVPPPPAEPLHTIHSPQAKTAKQADADARSHKIAPMHGVISAKDLPRGVPVYTYKPMKDDYMVVPEISDKPSFPPPPPTADNVEYKSDTAFPARFDFIKDVKAFTPELFFDPDDNDKFPDSYFTEKEKNKMSNYEVNKHNAVPEDYICVNVVEEITAAMLEDVMTRFDLCTCEKCKADVMAIALNDLTPKYVGTYKGQLFVKLAGYEKQYSTDVLSALTKACIHVKSNPRHE